METLENMNVVNTVETIEVKSNNVVEMDIVETVETEVKSNNVVEIDTVEVKSNNVAEMEIAETEVKSNNVAEMEIVETVETEVKDIIEDIENMEIDSKIDLETVLLETTKFINNLSDEKISKENLDQSIFTKYRKNNYRFNIQIIKDLDDILKNKLYNWLDTVNGFNKELMEKTIKVSLKIEKTTFRLLFGENTSSKIRYEYDIKGFLFLQDLNENDKKRFLDWAEDVVVDKIPVIQPPPAPHQRTLSRAEINLLRLQERSKQLNQPNNQQNNNWNRSYQPVQSSAPPAGGQRVNSIYNSSSRNPNNPNGRNVSINNRRRNVPMSNL
jgi:hypothetical protein